MLPPSLDELLGAGHPARFVAEFVDALDVEGWAEIGVDKYGDPMGAPSYHPRGLLGVWLYGFMTGVRSSRKLEAACRDQIPYLWLTGCQRPDHVTLWRFYHAHRDGMRKLLKRTGADGGEDGIGGVGGAGGGRDEGACERGKGPDLRRRRAAPSVGPVGRGHRRVGSAETRLGRSRQSPICRTSCMTGRSCASRCGSRCGDLPIGIAKGRST